MALDNVTFVKALTTATSQEFKDRIGTVTAENIANIGDIITQYPTLKNEFVQVLTNQVSKTLFFSKAYENPYKLFKRGILPYGKTIESIFVDIIKGKDRTRKIDTTDLASDLLARQIPNVKVEYWSENKQLQYATTISDVELKGAFRTENGLSSLTSRILQAPLNSAEYDEFLMVKQALPHINTAKVQIGKTKYTALSNKEKANVITTNVKAYIKKLKFLSNKYNGQGVMTFSNPSDLVLIVPSDISAFLDVEQLANAFNISKVELNTRVLDIDYFVKADGSEDGDTICYLLDKDAIQIWETLNESESFRNPQAKYTNIWFDKWGIVASCNFANAIKFHLA